MKRSEEPYTREDQELLEAIATSLALLVDRSAPFVKALTGTFRECPNCGELKRPHHVCAACGYYDGREVVDIEAA